MLVAALVGRPIVVAAVAAAVLLLTWVLARRRSRPVPRVLWVHAGLWVLYAAWEALVQWQTPEANIRVDLLLLWPLLALLAVWSVVAWVRQPSPSTH